MKLGQRPKGGPPGLPSSSTKPKPGRAKRTDDTKYLESIPGMKESLLVAMAEPAAKGKKKLHW